MVKCNSDGSFCEMNQRIGGGGIIRDHLGRWVASCYSGNSGNNVFQAEAVALLLSDAATSQRHSEFVVLLSIRHLLVKDWNVKINCVHRDSDSVADFLARRGAAAHASGLWSIASPDPDVEYLLLKDSLSVP
ncbi:uncharacterized protein LOC130713065 [Lotus japonicus]|uniref:uncharacterized protein LOC130713065 n=1 Tax=Lotus japonicus TaxID=34305 RepID=UPI0025889626|nr:uncharacterized protein LOC130713065 [Lotus japonicus]